MNEQRREAGNGPDLNEFYDPRLVAVYDTVNPIAEYEAVGIADHRPRV